MNFRIAVMFYLTNFISASLITPRREYQGPPDTSWPSSAGPWGKFVVVSRSLGQGFLVYWIHKKYVQVLRPTFVFIWKGYGKTSYLNFWPCV